MSEKSDLTLVLLAVLAVVSLTAGPALAAPVTQSITYQGKLTDTAGNPLTGTYSVTFSLYDVSSGGTAVAADTHSVTASNGLFTTQLTFSQNLFNGRALWLGIKVGSDPEMTPRQEIRPVPYALGLRPGAGITGTDSTATINLKNSGGGTALNAVTTGGNSPGVYGKAEGSSSAGVFGESTSYAGIFGKGVWGGRFETNQAGSGDFIPVGIWVRGLYANNKGLAATTDGPNSPAISAYSTGQKSYGVYAETTNSTSPAVYGKTFGGASEAVLGESAQYIGVMGKGVYGGRFETNQAGSGWFVPSAVVISAPYDNNNGLMASTTGANSPAVRASTTAGSSNAVWGSTSGNGPAAIAGTTSGAGSPGMYASTTGSGSHGYVASTSNQGADAFYGETSGWGSYGVLVKTTGDSGRGVYSETHGQDADGILALAEGANSNAIYAYSALGTGIYAEAGSGGGFAGDFRGNVNVRSKSSGASVLELGEGLDYSEGFDLSGEGAVTPGTVLVISPDDPGTLTVSSEPYDRKVAGIVAGANGLGSAVKVGGDKFDASVALAGRVYCNVDATYGAVGPGDQLTTSATPGYAMVVQDYAKAQGATIGKAMERLEEGQKGVILVLVTLQ